MKNNILKVLICYSCGVCSIVCPQKAVFMECDKKGFLYPKVNNELCTNCGICIDNCVGTGRVISDKKPIICIGCRLKKPEEIKNSSSGGAFVLVADFILQEQGYIVGAILTDTFEVEHIVTNNRIDRDKMRGSKYLQSDLKDVFIKVKHLLEIGKVVLFTGLPCQVAAIYKFLPNNLLENFYTIDLLCHGVPSKTVFSDYINWLEKKYGRIKKYEFRSRKCGWHGSNVYIQFQNGMELLDTIEANAFDSLYSRGFLTKETCYSCEYMSIERIGDFSIGDFWGIEKLEKSDDLKEGCSLVLVNTQKALKLWNIIKDKTINVEVSLEDCLQPSLYRKLNRNSNINRFNFDYSCHGFSYVAKRYAHFKALSKLYSMFFKLQSKWENRK